MPLSSLVPNECFIKIFSFLDNESLYKCLFVNRYYCKLSIPMIWGDPFTSMKNNDCTSLISTLFSCLNEDEISSLTPSAIDLTNVNNQPPLFEYGRFVRKIDHGYCTDHAIAWYYSLSKNSPEDENCGIQKLIDAIYHMIMRTGSNLQEFVINLSSYDCYFDLPKSSIFTTYKPGITNLRSLCLYDNDDAINDMEYQNTAEFLSMLPKFCNCIIECELNTSFLHNYQVLDIIKLQPLKSISLFGDYGNYRVIEKALNIFIILEEFRSETLKELSFSYINFQQIDLSSISKLECLEKLELVNCIGFTLKKKLYLKELKLWHNQGDDNVKLHDVSIINFLFSETLLKLSLNIITSETVKVVKETCPNVNFLCTESSRDDSLVIPLICELPSLKALNIKLKGYYGRERSLTELIKFLSNHLISIEHLFLDFHTGLKNFKYFVNNCKANLKSLNILIDHNGHRKKYLTCVNDFQKAHNSLKILGIGHYKYNKFDWTDEEIEIVKLLKNKGIDIVNTVPW